MNDMLYSAHELAKRLLPGSDFNTASAFAVAHVSAAIENLAEWKFFNSTSARIDLDAIVGEVREMSMSWQSKDMLIGTVCWVGNRHQREDWPLICIRAEGLSRNTKLIRNENKGEYRERNGKWYSNLEMGGKMTITDAGLKLISQDQCIHPETSEMAQELLAYREAEKEFAELRALVLKLGKGNAKRGIKKVMAAISSGVAG